LYRYPKITQLHVGGAECRLYAMRYCHATTASARLAVRALALQWNFHPYGPRLRRDQPMRGSPFHDLNSFRYHPNCLSNLLIASSEYASTRVDQAPELVR